MKPYYIKYILSLHNIILLLGTTTWEQLKNTQIKIALTETSLASDSSVCSYYNGVLNKFYTLITCNSVMSGQWVQVMMIVNYNQLGIQEIEVHGV